ncbi:hypothetical protein GA0070622_6421 [Micromonospora sediminicola]|uniref:Uncharacterized protein n=1 Tax=Micromonospora sediminicola TaxID=946078 RepID=A0A1A9BK83_9ACTN|nr:hypothetical protein [Micromonospora sediminicola]SBT69297.1 hypothetical protein GA0070622_6421 [Micromonospora sediminicola]
MSALPAEENYRPSPMPRIPFRREADVISLAPPRQEALPAPPLPESNQDETTRTEPASSGPNSGTGITLRDIPGDWDSVTAVWTGSPEPLADLVGQAGRAREGSDAHAIAMACWAVLVLIPRGLLHLASWVLAHPLRTLAAAAVAAVFIATL